MKSWPLRVKIALWSALVVALALLVSGVTTASHAYHEDIELLDHLLLRDVRAVFSELHRLPPDAAALPRQLAKLLPAAYRHRHIEIRHLGVLVYQSEKPSLELSSGEPAPSGQYSLPKRKLRLAVAEKEPWQVRVAIDTNDIRSSVRELITGFLFATPALLLITGFGGWWIARKALAPIDSVTQAAEKITAQHLDRRLPVPPSGDEVARLTLVLNRMIERLERSFLQAQRFSSDTSHELRTPLAVVHAGLEAMLSSSDVSPAQERQLLDLLDATTRLSSLSEKLLLLSRADAGFLQIERSRCDLAALLREAIEEASIFAEPSGIVIQAELPPRLEIEGDPSRLMQVWRNLLENAVKYNRRDGQVTVRLAEDSAGVFVCIENTGAALDEAQAGKLFHRFYRAEPHRNSPGHGLGLSISREIVRAHGGELTLESHQLDRIRFKVTLPHPG